MVINSGSPGVARVVLRGVADAMSKPWHSSMITSNFTRAAKGGCHTPRPSDPGIDFHVPHLHVLAKGMLAGLKIAYLGDLTRIVHGRLLEIIN